MKNAFNLNGPIGLVEVKSMNRKMLIASLGIVAVAMVVAIMMAYPAVSAASLFINGEQNGFPTLSNRNSGIVPNVWLHKMMRGQGCFGLFEVSEGFKDKVLTIAKSDGDVQKLLNDGYSIVNIKPIVKVIVGDDGSVTIKATGAIVTLSKDSARAIVKVDVENAKVTEVITLTKTVITKP